MDPRRQLVAEIETENEEFQRLAFKPDQTDDEFTRAEQLSSSIREKQQRLDGLVQREQRQAELRRSAQATQEWLSAPARTVPFSGNGGAGSSPPGAGSPLGTTPSFDDPNRPRILGYAPAGSMEVIDSGDMLEILSSGYGLMSPEKFLKLCSKEYKSAFMSMLRFKGNDRQLSDSQRFVLQEGIDDQGGYFVPPDWVASLVKREPTPTEVSSHVQSWDTVRDHVIFPKVQYTGASDDPNATLYSTGMRVTYPGEIPSDSSAIDMTQPVPGEIKIDVHTAMGAIPVSNNQLEDSAIAMQQFLMDLIRETVALEYDYRVLRGDGVGKARGILANPSSSATGDEPQYIVSGAAANLTGDGVKNLAFGLAPQYLRNAQFVMNWQSAAKEIDQLKDSTGNYLWSMGAQDNRLENSILGRRLQGFPVVYSEFMPSVGAGAFPIIFGNLRCYLLVRRLGMTIQVLRETKAKLNQVELVLRFRFGGRVWKPWGLKAQKVAAS